MTCDDLRARLTEIARGEADAVRDNVLAHVAACARCRDALAIERALSQGLRALAATHQSWDLPPEAEQRVLSAWDKETSRGRERRRLAGVAATAALAAAAAFALVRMPPAEPSRLAEPSVSKAPGARVVESQRGDDSGAGAASVVTEAASPRQPPSTGSKAAVRMTEAGALGSRSRQVVTFVPLGPADPDPAEPLQIMRVRLSRGSLAGFGLPVEDVSAGDELQADVLVGEDGVARAIRFVPFE